MIIEIKNKQDRLWRNYIDRIHRRVYRLFTNIIKDILEKMKTDVLVLAIENNRNEWKISIRSRIPELDLNALCKRLVESDNSCFLKGGGHSYSAGMTAMGKYEDIISKINANLAEKLA